MEDISESSYENNQRNVLVWFLVSIYATYNANICPILSSASALSCPAMPCHVLSSC